MKNLERTEGKSGSGKWVKEKESRRQQGSQGEPQEGRGDVRKEEWSMTQWSKRQQGRRLEIPVNSAFRRSSKILARIISMKQ